MPRLLPDEAERLRGAFDARARAEWEFVECVVKYELRKREVVGLGVDEVVSEVWFLMWAYNAAAFVEAVNPRGFLMRMVRAMVWQVVLNYRGFVGRCHGKDRRGHATTWVRRVVGWRDRYGACLSELDGKDDRRRAREWRLPGCDRPDAVAAAAELVEKARMKVPPCYRDRYANVRRELMKLESLAS